MRICKNDNINNSNSNSKNNNNDDDDDDDDDSDSPWLILSGDIDGDYVITGRNEVCFFYLFWLLS